MKNNFLKLTALWMVVACFAACQHDVDVIGISEGLAKKNMLGSYAYTAVDSALMQVTKIEVLLDKDEKGAPTGYYRHCVAGQQCTPEAPKTPITSWEAVMAEDGLRMLLTFALDNGDVHNMTWSENQLYKGKDVYVKSANSEIDAQNYIYGALANAEFAVLKTTYYEHKGRVDFMGWKQINGKTRKEKEGYLPKDTGRVASQKRAELEQWMDTIAWYMRFKSVTRGRIGYAYLDTVINGTDTTYVPRNVVRVNPNADLETGKHIISYLTQEDTVQWDIEQINDRPMERIESNMAFFSQGETPTTGSYFYHISTWKKDSYTEETPKPNPDTDSTYIMDASAWVLTKVVSKKKFDVLMKGTETVNNGEPKEDAFTEINLNSFDKGKGQVMVGELKYTLKK